MEAKEWLDSNVKRLTEETIFHLLTKGRRGIDMEADLVLEDFLMKVCTSTCLIVSVKPDLLDGLMTELDWKSPNQDDMLDLEDAIFELIAELQRRVLPLITNVALLNKTADPELVSLAHRICMDDRARAVARIDDLESSLWTDFSVAMAERDLKEEWDLGKDPIRGWGAKAEAWLLDPSAQKGSKPKGKRI